MFRRTFLRRTGAGLTATALPAWTLDLEAADGAVLDAAKLGMADAALETARRLGASYADVRINRYRYESVNTRERQVTRVARSQHAGIGVRVLVDGTWGFAANRVMTADEARRLAESAVAIARANAAHQRRPASLVPAARVVAKWKGAFVTDPFDVPLDRKIAFLLSLNEAALGVAGVSFVVSSMTWVNEQKFLATSDGSRIEQYLIRGLPSVMATAVNKDSGDFQSRRSFVGPRAQGYEYIESFPWLKEAREAGEDAVRKLSARPVVPGQYDLVIHPTNLWLTIHESVGHSTELDRALGWEADYAGTSFLTPDKAGTLQFGAPLLNFVADRTQPTGLATVGYDDEGVPAQRWHLIKDGRFVDWQTTRDLAAATGRKQSHGCLHADSWEHVSFPRMPNVSLEPGSGQTTLNDLVKGVDRGIVIYGDGSWSIDQQRYNFQFGGQTFWEIRNGKVAGMLRDVAYQSRSTDFWTACDGLGGRATYEVNGAFNDGKGQPGQINAVSHGCPVARFRKINVLNTGG